MPIVTISRGTMSGGARLAESLGSRLGLRVISREVVVEAAKIYGVSEEEIRKSLESPPGFWDTFARKRHHYILAVQATLAELVAEDNVVYHGIAGQLLLRELPNVLRIRLIAPPEQRIRAAMVQHNLSREEALRLIRKADEERAAWCRKVYDVDVTDPSLYDLVVNLGTVSLETATEMVADLLGRKEYRSTAETQHRLRDFALVSRVRAELALRSEFPEAAAHVSVHEGTVYLDLPPTLQSRRGRLVQFIGQISGVQRIEGMGEGEEGAAEEVRKWRTAADIMIPIKGYPHVPDSLPIREALLALGASAVVSSHGHLVQPRYLLVLDEAQRLVGVVNRRSLLRALIPQYASLQQVHHATRALPFTELFSTSALLWSSLFTPAAVAASARPIGMVMQPIRATVAHDDTVDAVLSTMLEQDVDLLPVTQGAKTVGVVMMTDVFDHVAEYILEKSAKAG